MTAFLQQLGARTLDQFRGWGHAAFFFLDVLRALPASLRRFGLVVAQVYAIGNRSLIIILASGLAVGFVLALQMYYALVTYGAAESLGLIVNLALVRELGPVVTALLFAGRAGTSLTAEIGLMKAGEQIAAMELMAIDPKVRVLAPRFIGGIVSMPILAVLFSAVGILGAYVVAVLLIGGGRGQLLVDHADARGRVPRCRQRPREGGGLRRHLHAGGAVPGLRDRSHARRRGLRHHPHGGSSLRCGCWAWTSC